MKSIQFIGTQRSGSNLLRVMLHQLPEICAPHPPHILQTMYPFLPLYGDLNRPENFRKLIDDVCSLVEFNPVNWGIKFDRETVEKKSAAHNLPQIAKAIYELKAEADQAEFWCCKSMANIHFIDQIEEAGIHPFYIHLYRDGRDVALSFMKAIVGDKHIYQLAKQWKLEQDLSDALCKKIGPGRSIQIRYEEFVLDPAGTVMEICRRTGIPYSAAALEYNQSAESAETAGAGAMWGNLVKPVMKENTRKFMRELSADDIRIFETVAADTLIRLGYVPENKMESLHSFTEEEISRFGKENAERKKEARQKASAEDVLKRKAQDEFIDSLRKRHDTFKLSKAVNE